ncbi:MAG: S-layer homology domain-containing protein, partial [Lachnospiraceae bacterium]|nr:S-layer homology domain-containing protein [Lachnospiraceae bacterium]
VSWGPSAGASGYILRYGPQNSGVWYDEIPVTGASNTTNTVGPRAFQGGQNYDIQVVGTAADGSESMPSAAVFMGRFSDVTDESLFYFNPVYWAAQKNITTGYDDNTFRPMGNCNRASVVTFLWRLAGSPAVSGAFPFSDPSGNPDFDMAIKWAVQNGITTGWESDNTFRPWNTCNRLSVVTFLYRYGGGGYIPGPGPAG